MKIDTKIACLSQIQAKNYLNFLECGKRIRTKIKSDTNIF